MNCVEFIVCPCCLDEVSKSGYPAAQLLLSTCEDYCLLGIPSEISYSYFSDTSIFPVVEYLERKGFIVSTETDLDSIQFKPLGLKCKEYEDGHVICHICVKREQHQFG